MLSNLLLDGLDTDRGLVGEEDKHLICGVILLLDHEHQSVATIIKEKVKYVLGNMKRRQKLVSCQIDASFADVDALSGSILSLADRVTSFF